MAQGLSLRTGLSIGWTTFIISVSVLLLWIPLREKPGLGTIANAVVIALALQVGVQAQLLAACQEATAAMEAQVAALRTLGRQRERMLADAGKPAPPARA